MTSVSSRTASREMTIIFIVTECQEFLRFFTELSRVFFAASVETERDCFVSLLRGARMRQSAALGIDFRVSFGLCGEGTKSIK